MLIIVLPKILASQTPTNSNVKSTKFITRKGVLFIETPMKDIKGKLLITNQKGKKLLEYIIAK